MQTFNVLDFGAVANVEESQTKAFQAALDACFLAGGGEVVVPEGSFVIGDIRMRSNTTLHLLANAKLLGSRDPWDYMHINDDALEPLPEEQNMCIDWLREQTRLLKPKIIVCLGRISATRLISPDFKVTKQHGQFIEKNGTLMMGTFHPAALLRNPNQKPEALEDFLALRDKIIEVCPETYEM
jgi:hypothetical protein